ncbi:hypothetical protein HPTD01_2969 [Halomonas sp. TD01]|nr:hypothetical protein HPTD01_2969 [Halomonas sp. TD01]
MVLMQWYDGAVSARRLVVVSRAAFLSAFNSRSANAVQRI